MKSSSSEAAANLCAWVVNTVAYNKVYKNVAPKMAAQSQATDELNDAQAKLKGVEDRVAAMQAKLASVTGSLTEATNEKNKVEAEAANCQQRLELANRLVDGLAGRTRAGASPSWSSRRRAGRWWVTRCWRRASCRTLGRSTRSSAWACGRTSGCRTSSSGPDPADGGCGSADCAGYGQRLRQVEERGAGR